MEKQEAAQFLGVSVRTLERFCAAGRLTKGRARKKTRPVVTFDREQLETLKAELETVRPVEAMRQKAVEKPRDAIGFRLDPFYIQRLTEEGAKREMSAGEYARRLVIQSLEDTRVEQFRDEVHALREGMADIFYAFLTMQCNVSEAKALAFVKDTILKGEK